MKMKIPKMRALSVLPALCALVGFVLVMLCIFAGSSPGYLEDSDLLTLNTSMIGIHAFNSQPSSSSSSSSTGSSSFLGALTSKASTISSDISNEVGNEINKGIQDIARDLNISDFYSWHLLDFCQGYYEPGPLVNASNTAPWKNVTACSNRTGFYTFNATHILEAKLRAGLNLSSLDWPSGLEAAIDTVAGASRAIFVLYCMGAATAGLAIIVGAMAVLKPSMLHSLLNAGLLAFSFFLIGLASTIANIIVDQVLDAINEVGPDVGIEAIKGTKFIALTWAATALLAFGSFGWSVEIFLAKRRSARQNVEKLEE